jgi:hypothetical protein
MAFYTRTLTFLKGVLARGDHVRQELDAVQTGFASAETNLDQTIRFTGAGMEGPNELSENAAGRANKVVAFDADGDPALLSAVDAAAYPVSPFMETLLDDESAAAARTTLGALPIVASQTASADATIDFTANDYPSLFDGTYAKVVFELATVTPATDDTYLIMLVGTGATPTWQSGASAYSWAARGQGSTAGADLGSAADSFATGIALTRVGSTHGLGTAANEHATITLEGARLGQAERIYWHWTGTYINSEANLHMITGGGQHASATAITGVRFLMSSGNIASGTFTAYGIV